MKISYNWLKWYIPEIPPAEKMPDIFTFHLCEVESVEKLPDGDTVFDVNILPNRAHDLLSHMGISYELSGLLGIPWVSPMLKYKIPETKSTNLKIELATANCRRYMGRIVRNVKVGPSPEWVVKHLTSIGQRSINNIVDATNLCMFDCGQPMHAFDLDKLQSSKLVVQSAKKGEKITTLDGKEVELTEIDMVISDEKNALAIAGVKGGKKAEVDANTKNILLEVANFDPTSVRKTSQRLQIKTDSSKRFENELSPEMCGWGMTELSALITDMCPEATFEEIVDNYPQKQKHTKLSFSAEYISRVLGIEVSKEKIEKILKSYHFEYKKKKPNFLGRLVGKTEEEFILDVPCGRLDLVGPHDMAEEIGRVIGYDKVAPRISKINFTPKINETFVKINAAREKLLTDGYGEVITYAFQKKGDVEVAYSAEGKQGLRKALKPGLEEAYKKNVLNAPLLGRDPKEVKIFEIGAVFLKDKEEIHVAWADKKGIKEETLDRHAELVSASHGQNHQVLNHVKDDSSGTKELIANSQRLMAKIFKPWSSYPFISRDIAVWVSQDTKEEELVSLYKTLGGNLLVKEPTLFDAFTKDGKTSYAHRLVFQSFEKTLTDNEINEIMEKIYSTLKEKGWEAR